MNDEKRVPLEIALARKRIEHEEAYIHDAKAIIEAYEDLPPSVKAEHKLLPNIDLHELEHDPEWRSWKKDAEGRCTFPAEEGEAGWLRLKNAGNTVATLYKAMKRRGLEKVSLGLFEYKLSGDDFLQRRPLKKPEAPGDSHAKMEKNIQNVKEAGQRTIGRGRWRLVPSSSQLRLL